MSEDYVNKETAILLKELGFDWATRAYTDGSGLMYDEPLAHWNTVVDCVAVPNLYNAQKWLREEKGIKLDMMWIEVGYGKPFEETYSSVWDCSLSSFKEGIDDEFSIYKETYEEALQAGILEACKHLKENHE